MSGLRVPTALIVLLLTALIITLTDVRAIAQEPAATPTPACSTVTFEGPTVWTLGAVQVEVPAGSYGQTLSPPGPEPTRVLCHIETGAEVTLSGARCEELGRSASTDEGEEVINAIVASCTSIPQSDTPPPHETCPPGGGPVEGGQTHQVMDAIEVTLPPGDFEFVIQGDILQICAADEGFLTSRRLTDCTTATILPPEERLLAIDREISCTALDPPPLPTTPPFSPNPNIVPPSTGTAGLQGTYP